MNLFTTDNTSGYSQIELDDLNAQWEKIVEEMDQRKGQSGTTKRLCTLVIEQRDQIFNQEDQAMKPEIFENMRQANKYVNSLKTIHRIAMIGTMVLVVGSVF